MTLDRECGATIELFTELLEGVLSPQELVDVELHLVTCPGCAAVLLQLRAATNLLAGLPKRGLSQAAHRQLRELAQVRAGVVVGAGQGESGR